MKKGESPEMDGELELFNFSALTRTTVGHILSNRYCVYV